MRSYLTFFIFLVGLFATSSVLAGNVNVGVGGTMVGSGGYYGGSTPVLMFSPAQVTINVGDTVTFNNNGGASHNVHADDDSFRCSNGCRGQGSATGDPSISDWTSQVTFTHAGTFGYHCDLHGSMGMVGTIIVKAATPTINLGGYLSGNWFIPSQGGGQGFQLEFTNANNDMIAIWFAYTPAGSTANDGSGQNWIYSEGAFDPTKNTVTLPAILLAGARFPPNFHSADVHRVPNDASTWGTITFTFSDCNTGMVSWHSDLAGYNNANDTPVGIQRLTQIAGTTCPQ
jgi:plastocyanin